MSEVEKVSYKGKEIVRIDFSSCKNKEAIQAVIDKALSTIKNSPRNSVYTLTIVNGAYFSNETTPLFKAYVEGNAPYVKAAAIVGADSLRKVIVSGLKIQSNRQLTMVSSESEAKEFLAAN
jgi:hypothetical protein